jgi:SAM-dependent methyltransferase
MDFSQFDTRHYPTLSVQDGYAEWAPTYEDDPDALDLRLLERIRSIGWDQLRAVADLACGTGRTGAWLKQRGVAFIDGVDCTAAMLAGARAKGIYRELVLADLRATPLPPEAYDLVTVVLVDEHLPALAPLYREGARIARPGGYLVLVGYHPFFMLRGIPTHFTGASGQPIAIQCYVHLLSDHVQAALAAGWSLLEMHEGLIDDEKLARKPTWGRYRHCPVSFALVWQKPR